MPLVSFGASVAGPGHLRDGLPNQDAWGHAAVAGGRVVVVADGLGSKQRADAGAAAACRAVPDALRVWARYPGAAVEVLLGMIHMLWRARLGDVTPEEAATTCLFAFMREDGSGLLGQLGDGLALVLEGESLRSRKPRSDNAFGNHTRALGVTRRLGAWKLDELEPAERTVVLCTDGVADDLLEHKRAAFVQWIEQELAPMSAGRRWRRIARELRQWPTPHHIDDKTLAVLRRTS